VKRYSQFRGEVRRHPVWNCRDAIKEREQREFIRELREMHDKEICLDPLWILGGFIVMGITLYHVFGG